MGEPDQPTSGRHPTSEGQKHQNHHPKTHNISKERKGEKGRYSSSSTELVFRYWRQKAADIFWTLVFIELQEYCFSLSLGSHFILSYQQNGIRRSWAAVLWLSQWEQHLLQLAGPLGMVGSHQCSLPMWPLDGSELHLQTSHKVFSSDSN